MYSPSITLNVRNIRDIYPAKKTHFFTFNKLLSFHSKKISQEQDKSSDIEQQPPFGDRKISNIQPQNSEITIILLFRNISSADKKNDINSHFSVKGIRPGNEG